MVSQRRLARRRTATRSSTRLLFSVGVALLLTGLAVGSISEIGRASGPYRRDVARSFGSLVGPLAVQSEAGGTGLVAILDHGPTMDRQALFSALDSIAAEAARASRQLAAAVPPTPAGAEDCLTAMSRRAGASRQIQDALESLLGGPEGFTPGSEASAVTALDQAGNTLHLSDTAWETCRLALRQGPGTVRIPPTAWAPDPAPWAAGSLGQFVASISGSPTLTAHHQLEVAANSLAVDPTAVSVSNGAAVIPPTRPWRCGPWSSTGGTSTKGGWWSPPPSPPKGARRSPRRCSLRYRPAPPWLSTRLSSGSRSAPGPS